MAKSAGRKTTTKKSTESEMKYLCPYCNKEKKRSQFYVSTDPRNAIGITFMCKDCVKKIAFNWDEYRQEYGTPTKKSVMDALEYLDRPFLETLWTSSYNEWLNPDSKNKKKSIWDTYIKNVSMQQYNGMRWRDGDIFNTYVEDAKVVAGMETVKTESNQEINEEFEKNKRDVIRLLGYDPFESEKPVILVNDTLYASLDAIRDTFNVKVIQKEISLKKYKNTCRRKQSIIYGHNKKPF